VGVTRGRIDRARLRAALDRAPRAERLFDRSMLPEARSAAVVLPIALGKGDDEDGVWLFVVERASHLRDHAGELGFPGGKPEPGDRDLADTALRELEEEVGVTAAEVELLVGLGPCPVITGKYVLEPFVGLLVDGVVPRIASGELVAVHRLAIGPLVRGEAPVDAVRGVWRGQPVVSPFFGVGGGVLYGASAAIAYDLVERLAAATGLAEPQIAWSTKHPWGDRYAT
jgi:8-oxo-dGTP pyrophosphatase MutT (NUDIX family)